jgi:hypothetical protein
MRDLDPEEMRRRAKDLLAAADHARDAESRAALVRMAASYADMARQMEEIILPRAGRWDLGQQQPAQQPQSGGSKS